MVRLPRRAQDRSPLWRLIIHDYTKFSRAEWTPYVTRFFDDLTPRDATRFAAAWKHHYTHNPHHWNYWLNDSVQYGVRTAQEPPYAREMPEHFVREMVADWMGAGKAITGRWEVDEWYAANKDKIQLHARTRVQVESLLKIVRPS